MTVPVQVLAAVRSIPHPRQEPDMTAPDPRFRDQLLYALRTAPDIPVLWPGSDKIVDALMPTIAAEVARVQAAANQRAAEVITDLADDFDNGPLYAEATDYFSDRDVDADGVDVARIIRAAALASPAPS